MYDDKCRTREQTIIVAQLVTCVKLVEVEGDEEDWLRVYFESRVDKVADGSNREMRRKRNQR
jgi:hypothetical protein